MIRAHILSLVLIMVLHQGRTAGSPGVAEAVLVLQDLMGESIRILVPEPQRYDWSPLSLQFEVLTHALCEPTCQGAEKVEQGYAEVGVGRNPQEKPAV